MKYTEILARNRQLGEALRDRKPYRVVLLSNIVVSPLVDVLEYALRSIGIPARIEVGDFDNIVQDSERFANVDAAVIFWETCNLVDGLHARIGSMETQEIEGIRSRTESEIALVMRNLARVPLVLFNAFSSLVFTASELRPSPLARLARSLSCVLDDHDKALRVDLDSVLAITGLQSATDFRQFQSSRALYSMPFFKNYAAHVVPAFASVAGRARKVLVLDCDNTLWGGVLGEDGEQGIQAGPATRIGKVFREVQSLLQGFRREGILLAICSKNNPEDVRHVFDHHPDMLLSNEDFAATRVNWQDKASNLRELAAELNVGLDSFVFVDDSDFELGLIRDMLPEVATVHVPRELSEYPQVMREARRLFFNLTRTAEDGRRTQMYQEEIQRRSDAIAFASVDDYLRSLGLVLSIARNRREDAARIAQMTQKTNQFNLTTRRYTETDVLGFLDDGGYVLFSFSVADRYGDYGVTGLAIIEWQGSDEARIDVFLMSCRVIGRNIERAFMDEIVASLQMNGVKRIRAEYLRTPKNDQVCSLLDSLGFEQTGGDNERKQYHLLVEAYIPQNIEYIRIQHG